MCKSKKSTDVIIPSSSTPRSHTSKSTSTSSSFINPSSSSSLTATTNFTTSSTSSFSSKKSFPTLKETLPENPHIYDFPEICRATNNFLNKPFSSSSSSTSWRCKIRGKDVILFQRKLRRPIQSPELQRRLLTICKSHHSSLIKLLGAATSGSYIYLVYEYVNGATLSNCLRNKQNLNYTVLSSWLSRMQIATDIAHGLDYIHNCSELCGEMVEEKGLEEKNLGRQSSGRMKIEGTRGYMAPEFQGSGIVTQKCDVYAFGVVVLELVSGEDALRYYFDEERGGYRRTWSFCFALFSAILFIYHNQILDIH
ncbi:hypothetical protein Tsubulata_027811 [Turnera subulata]|uniref:Protein kinase domain-containing protein n=1 Tax=Turnera subulata TaxID=218843 RepID=A0A9Q0JKC5_9ROSI|nr:hypothetical protein Tsubulata_027811 [Turnera subulata]